MNDDKLFKKLKNVPLECKISSNILFYYKIYKNDLYIIDSIDFEKKHNNKFDDILDGIINELKKMMGDNFE